MHSPVLTVGFWPCRRKCFSASEYIRSLCLLCLQCIVPDWINLGRV